MLIVEKEPIKQSDIDLSSVIDYHVKLTVEAIYTGMFSGPSPASISFRHVLSRIMILLQEPVTFILFKKDNTGNREEVYRANKHKRHRKYIDVAITKARESADESYFFNAFGMGYELLCLIAETNKQGFYEFDLLKVEERPPQKERWSIASYKLRCILEIKQFGIYGERFYADLKGALDRCVDISDAPSELLSVQSAEAKNRFSNHWKAEKKEAFGQFLLNLSENTSAYRGLSQYGVIDKVFSKLKDNLLAIAAGGFIQNKKDGIERVQLTNFILFARDYSSPVQRHGNDYDYQLQLIVCSRQQAEWENAFRLWALYPDSSINRRSYLKLFENLTISADKQEEVKLVMESARRVNDYFWALIDDGAPKDIINVMKAPFGSSARSMADPVFDGVSYFRDPFSEGGIKRCFDPSKNFKETLQKELGLLNEKSVVQVGNAWADVLRVVACHYLFDAMTDPTRPNEDPNPTKDKSDRLRIMLNPIEVGGRVWGVIGYLTQNHTINNQADRDGLTAYDLHWRQNYHVYQDVNSRVKKNLRADFLRLYEKTVASTFVRCLNTLHEVNKEYGSVEMLIPQETINDHLSILSCFFPYNSINIEFKIVESPGDTSEPHGSPTETSSHRIRITGGLGEGAYAECSGDVNSFFPAPPGMKYGVGDNFISLTNLAVEATNLLSQYIDSQGRLIQFEAEEIDEKSTTPD